MAVLYMEFSHPIKGTATFKQLNSLKPQILNLLFDSKNSNQVEIQTSQCVPGKWLITLNWQYDGRSFSYNGQFEVNENIHITGKIHQKLLNTATSSSPDSDSLNPVNKMVETLPG